MTTSLELLNAVRRNVGRTDMDTELKRAINLAKRELAVRLGIEQIQEVEYTIREVEGIPEPTVTMPSDYRRIVAVLYRQTEPTVATSWTEIPKLADRDARLAVPTTASGLPRAYMLDGATLTIIPPPGPNVAYAVRILYYAYPADYTLWNATESDWWSKEAFSIVEAFATAAAFASMGEHADANAWEQRAERRFAAFKGLERLRQMGGEFVLTVRSGAKDVLPPDPWRV